MKFRPLSENLGVEVSGADLRLPDHRPKILKALSDHGVVVVRNQFLNPLEQLDAARSFGAINVNRFFTPHPEYPEVALVVKEPEHGSVVGEDWHTDHSYDPEPAMCSLLQAVECPSSGGDTRYSSMAAAFAALSPAMQELLYGLQAWHNSFTFGNRRDVNDRKDERYHNPDLATQESLHPVVIRHPLSGLPCIYVNPVFTERIDGMKEAESRCILDFLFQHCRQPEFQCTVHWKEGTVTIWDNRATWHKANNDYPGQRRIMHRVTVDGTTLQPWRSH